MIKLLVSRAALFSLLYASIGAWAADRSWIERSDRNSAMVLEILGRFEPEQASEFGIDSLDAAVLDLRPGVARRYDLAAGNAIKLLSHKRRMESDPAVRLDLDILIEAVGRMRHSRALEHRLLLPYFDLPRQVFQGLQVVLDQRNGEARRRSALQRLQRYAGMQPGVAPLATLAMARLKERFGTAKLLGPYDGEVRHNLANCARYVAGIDDLFRSSGLRDWEPAQVRLAGQLQSYCEWVEAEVLPRARKNHAFPRELYADRLKGAGIDIEPEQAISMGTFAFTEIRDEMIHLAAQIAKERNIADADYRSVLRELKRDAVPPGDILALYRGRLKDLENIVVRERIITLPQRPASIRLASEAESAAVPAPYMNAPRLVGNQGEVGEFVLPLRNPNATSRDQLDDFTADGASWTLTAHEARPGHELQFAAMVERGISLARAVFAFNSANVEGWGLYAESIMLPYFPPEGQLFSLQLRLLRAARAFLDPMVNLGAMTPADAKAFLIREAAFSEPFAQQEADRYAFEAPGQAISYFYGYKRLRELRLKAELALGSRFNQQEFHDLVMAQGLLPLKLLERSVMETIAQSH